jgi:hypothetical protein
MAENATPVNLMIVAEAPDAGLVEHRFGGAPLAPEGFEWPSCRSCAGTMQFLGQLKLPQERLLLLFMCQNDPGMCDEWDANAGGNAAFVLDASASLRLLAPPPGDAVVLGGSWGATLTRVEVDMSGADEFETAYDEARDEYERKAGEGRLVLGQLGGEPAWIQGAQTPHCDACGQSMRFELQLEEGPDHRTAMNFGGGGVAFAFSCGCGQAKMLWQS